MSMYADKSLSVVRELSINLPDNYIWVSTYGQTCHTAKGAYIYGYR